MKPITIPTAGPIRFFISRHLLIGESPNLRRPLQFAAGARSQYISREFLGTRARQNEMLRPGGQGRRVRAHPPVREALRNRTPGALPSVAFSADRGG